MCRAGWLLAGIPLACSSSSPPHPCPNEQPPAFSITVRAADGPLPDDTRIVMAYGGGSEEYALGTNHSAPSVMFCTPELVPQGSSGAHAGGGSGTPTPSESVDHLVCDLWIEGAATIWVQGGDYAKLEVELSGEANECGPQTVFEELVLGEDETSTGSP